MKELYLIILGFLLGTIPPWFMRKRRLRTHWCALRADMEQCNEKAEKLLKDNKMSPLYRLPLIAYCVSFPVLLADGAVKENEVLLIGRYFNMAEELNRGLDNADEMLKLGNDQRLQQEFNRNCLKAKELIKPNYGNDSLYAEAKRIIDSKISAKWWQFIKHTYHRGECT
jgi:hypothetical protein